MKFTDRSIAALKPRPERYEVWESGGFGMRVGTSGRKSWIFVYRHAGKPRRMTLGEYSALSLSKARVAAAVARDTVRSGGDPAADRVAENLAERSAETVGELAAEYLVEHADKKKRASSAAEDRRLIDVEILPAWRLRKAKHITRRDVIRLLDEIEKRGSPVTRNRTAALISTMFGVGVARGILDHSPAIGISRLKEIARQRRLNEDEIKGLRVGLDKAEMDRKTALAILFALVTGQRRGEVAGIHRDEIDTVTNLWRLPAERTKNGRPNVIPLPPLAMRIFHEADKLRGRPVPVRPNRKDRRPYDPTPSAWLFPSRYGDKPLEPAALTRALNRNRALLGIGDATIHDLRRTFATQHGELGTPPEILKALLNHTPTEITEQVYNHALNLEPRRLAMEAWCNWLEVLFNKAARSMRDECETSLVSSSSRGIQTVGWPPTPDPGPIALLPARSAV